MTKIKAHNSNGLVGKFIGLIGSGINTPIYFETRWGIHTFFLRSSIQLVVLDDDLKVMNIYRVRPNSIKFWNPFYRKILEIPIENQLDIEIGEKIDLDLI